MGRRQTIEIRFRKTVISGKNEEKQPIYKPDCATTSGLRDPSGGTLKLVALCANLRLNVGVRHNMADSATTNSTRVS